MKKPTTSKAITFAALNSHYLNTSTNRINADYLNDSIIIWGENTQAHYNAYTKGRSKIHSVVWAMLADLAAHLIRENEYPSNQNFYASSEQLKAWLQQYGDGYDTIAPAVEHFQALRDEYRSEAKEA